MSNKFKEIDIKNRQYYFFDDMINIKNLNPNKIDIDEKTFFITFGMLRSKILTLEKL